MAAAGIMIIHLIWWPRPFNSARPDFEPAFASMLLGLGFVLGSFRRFAADSGKNRERVFVDSSVGWLLVGMFEIGFSLYLAYAKSKILGY